MMDIQYIRIKFFNIDTKTLFAYQNKLEQRYVITDFRPDSITVKIDGSKNKRCLFELSEYLHSFCKNKHELEIPEISHRLEIKFNQSIDSIISTVRTIIQNLMPKTFAYKLDSVVNKIVLEIKTDNDIIFSSILYSIHNLLLEEFFDNDDFIYILDGEEMTVSKTPVNEEDIKEYKNYIYDYLSKLNKEKIKIKFGSPVNNEVFNYLSNEANLNTTQDKSEFYLDYSFKHNSSHDLIKVLFELSEELSGLTFVPFIISFNNGLVFIKQFLSKELLEEEKPKDKQDNGENSETFENEIMIEMPIIDLILNLADLECESCNVRRATKIAYRLSHTTQLSEWIEILKGWLRQMSPYTNIRYSKLLFTENSFIYLLDKNIRMINSDVAYLIISLLLSKNEIENLPLKIDLKNNKITMNFKNLEEYESILKRNLINLN